MRPEERRRHILELLRQRERISVDELARTLSTSQETIRRDLAALAEANSTEGPPCRPAASTRTPSRRE